MLGDLWDDKAASFSKTCGHDKLQTLLQAASSIENDTLSLAEACTTAFTNEKDALLMCVRQKDANGNVLKHQKNVGIFEQNGKFIVQTTGDLRARPFLMSQFDHISFTWLKALDREHRYSHNQHTMIKLSACTKLEVKPRSAIKKAYKLPNNKLLKLMHHSCACLTLPNDRSCDNCKKNNKLSPDKIVFKCKRGEDLWHVCDP